MLCPSEHSISRYSGDITVRELCPGEKREESVSQCTCVLTVQELRPCEQRVSVYRCCHCLRVTLLNGCEGDGIILRSQHSQMKKVFIGATIRLMPGTFPATAFH